MKVGTRTDAGGGNGVTIAGNIIALQRTTLISKQANYRIIVANLKNTPTN